MTSYPLVNPMNTHSHRGPAASAARYAYCAWYTVLACGAGVSLTYVAML